MTLQNLNVRREGGTAPRHHVLSVLVENRAGVLARVASLFARRGYNIYSLAVAPTDDERFSRITVVVDVESAPLEQVVKQLNKLINVIKISELDPRDSVERELMLVTVKAPGIMPSMLQTKMKMKSVNTSGKYFIPAWPVLSRSMPATNS